MKSKGVSGSCWEMLVFKWGGGGCSSKGRGSWEKGLHG